VETLRVYLDCWGSLARSGAVLHLHPNAVAHRMKRIRTLLPADLEDPEQRLAVQIACRVWGGRRPVV
jgi:DNA-binding PucR family transcriptional regulator